MGAGGLGAPIALYLGAAGVGTLGIIDNDVVAESNLHRQVLFEPNDVGRPKVEVVRHRVLLQNPFVSVIAHVAMLLPSNAMELLQDYDIVMDATDNFMARYLINDACVTLGKPCISASIYRFEGQLSVYWANHGPCYRCLYPEPPPDTLVPSCAEGGVLGILPGIMGTLQSNEAIKLMIGAGSPLIGRLLTFDALEMKFNEFGFTRDPRCSICANPVTVQNWPTIEKIEKCDLSNTNFAPDESVSGISVSQLMKMIASEDAFLLLDVRNQSEYEISHIPGSTLIPVDDLEDRIEELPTDVQIVCYCHSGKRSRRAAQVLHARGISQVRSLTGGVEAWNRDNKSIVRD